MTFDICIPEWTRRAACNDSQITPDLFFPASAAARGLTIPYSICAGCPVRAECGAYAVAENIPFGIWGGVPRGRG